MKVRELIARLKHMPQDAECVMDYYDGTRDEHQTCEVDDLQCYDDKSVRLAPGDEYKPN